MPERIGIMVTSYGSRGMALADAFRRSGKYDVDLYIADKQRNPFGVAIAKAHEVVPGLDIDGLYDFAKRHRSKLAFAVPGSEGPVIDGLRDRLEGDFNIPVVCPTSNAALEVSKVEQRELIERFCPEANPRYKVFQRDPADGAHIDDLRASVSEWYHKLDGRLAVKPELPGFGKGVGVSGDHFTTFDEMWDKFFWPAAQDGGKVILEEYVEGQEVSQQVFTAGGNYSLTPCVRDFKRAFNGDRGPNTGGMGTFSGPGYMLPFMDGSDWGSIQDTTARLFEGLNQVYGNELRGVSLYIAYTLTGDGAKILEINSRPGDPEWMNTVVTMEDDPVDTFLGMANDELRPVNFNEGLATVLTYAVPQTYGGKGAEIGNTRLNLGYAFLMEGLKKGKLRLFPGSMELMDDSSMHTLKSRTIASVGIGESIQEARETSLLGIAQIDGNLWHRTDIASEEYIQQCIGHMESLRGGA